MNNLKFRAWDKVEKVMKYFVSGIFNRVPDGIEDLTEPMQYTGLTDKNDKEIYEGDIFTKYFNYLAKRLNGVVVFKDGAYIVAFSRKTEFLLMDVLWDKTAEVIGNTYENPELLEVQG